MEYNIQNFTKQTAINLVENINKILRKLTKAHLNS